jgi:hypothetical protein
VANADHKSRSEIVGAVLNYLVSIMTILGVPIALLGYFAVQQQSRVDKTFEFYKSFHAEGVLEDVNLLVEKYEAKKDEIKKVLATPDQKGLEKLQESLVMQDAKANAALIHVIKFYDGVGPCIDHLLCDGDAAIALLQAPASEVVSGYGAYLHGLQKDGSTFATGVFTVNNLTTTSKILWLFPWLPRGSN